jgi:hypothetical protein
MPLFFLQVMENLYENRDSVAEFSQIGDTTRPDFSAEELCILKTMFLELEKAIDDIPVESGGSTFHGSFIIDLLAKAEVCYGMKVLSNWENRLVHLLLYYRKHYLEATFIRCSARTRLVIVFVLVLSFTILEFLCVFFL